VLSSTITFECNISLYNHVSVSGSAFLCSSIGLTTALLMFAGAIHDSLSKIARELASHALHIAF
jgi:hypothetical protein